MPTPACTSNYTTVVRGYVPGSGDTVGTVVTFTTPKPEWSDATNQRTIQCNAVALGGTNGLNN